VDNLQESIVSTPVNSDKPGSPAPSEGVDTALQDGNDCLQAGLRLLREFRLAVLPLCAPSHVGIDRVVKGHRDHCQSPGKRPWIKWQEFQKRLPTEEEVKGWWKRYALGNLGMATGPVSGVIRADVDGQAAWEALQEKAKGDLPATVEFVSGREDGTGKGLLFRIPEGVVLRTTPEPRGKKEELRFQSEGAQTVLPPSRHASGKRYEWVPGRAPWEHQLALAPEWLVKELAEGARQASGKKRVRVRPGAAPPPADAGQPGGAHEGNGQTDAGDGRADRVPAEVLLQRALDAKGHRNDRGFDLARWMRDEGYSEAETGEVVGEFQKRVENDPDKDHPYTRAEAMASVGSAFDRPPRPPEVHEAVNDPHRLARLIRADHDTDDGIRLAYWREAWQRWEGLAWREVPDQEMRSRACRRIKAEFDECNLRAQARWRADGAQGDKPVAQKVTTRVVSDTLAALASLVILRGDLATPCWMGGAGPFPAGEVLACRNTLIHLPSWADGLPCTHPLTPRFFSPNALDFDFLPGGPPPQGWLDFLGKLWPDDDETVGALQEWFGYCLLPDTSQHKILMLVGPTRGGKGTIARVLNATVGPRNVCAPTLSSLGTPFGLQPLLGKTLATISDARLSGRADLAQVVERLLSISGEDAQSVDRKFKETVTTRLPVRFTLLTNELPKVTDASGVLAHRFVILRQTVSWLGREDTALTRKLLGELPGVLLWALEGYKRLRERGHFMQPLTALDLVQEMRDLASPVGAFVRERCRVEPGAVVPVKTLFEQWREWCEEKGRKEHGTEPSFGRDLRAAVPGLGKGHPRPPGGGKRYRTFVGIRLLNDDELDDGDDRESASPF
jgi:putative DNA primase/helicase